MIQPSRRSLITGLISFMASPAIVRASSLMPVKRMASVEDLLRQRMDEAYALTRKQLAEACYGPTGLYHELAAVTRNAFVPRLRYACTSQPALMELLAPRQPA